MEEKKIKRRYLSVEEVASGFGLAPTTIYRLARQGKLPGLKVGFKWRFNEDLLDSWVAKQSTKKRRKTGTG